MEFTWRIERTFDHMMDGLSTDGLLWLDGLRSGIGFAYLYLGAFEKG